VQNLFSVEGKTVVVTGGSRGIGAMIAEGFLRNGAKSVYITARKVEECQVAVARLSAFGKCEAFPADLTKPEGIELVAREVEAREQSLDVLINNAGAVWAEPFDEFGVAAWDKVMNINVKAVFFLTQRLHKMLTASASHENPARVINIGSIDGLHCPPLETYPYSASKAAVHHLTRTLAARLAPDNILVNCLAPGPFESKMMAATLAALGDQIKEASPVKRIGRPEDIAGAAIFLASRASMFITGAVIPVDGGISTTL
jgi:NAD(P)-dependent dehydrogenase (short-subunit alcohol dehydrogenase family)